MMNEDTYLVRWKGLSSELDEWVKQSDFNDLGPILDYHKKLRQDSDIHKARKQQHESKKQKVRKLVIEPKLDQLVKEGIEIPVIPVIIEPELDQSVDKSVPVIIESELDQSVDKSVPVIIESELDQSVDKSVNIPRELRFDGSGQRMLPQSAKRHKKNNPGRYK